MKREPLSRYLDSLPFSIYSLLSHNSTLQIMIGTKMGERQHTMKTLCLLREQNVLKSRTSTASVQINAASQTLRILPDTHLVNSTYPETFNVSRQFTSIATQRYCFSGLRTHLSSQVRNHKATHSCRHWWGEALIRIVTLNWLHSAHYGMSEQKEATVAFQLEEALLSYVQAHISCYWNAWCFSSRVCCATSPLRKSSNHPRYSFLPSISHTMATGHRIKQIQARGDA